MRRFGRTRSVRTGTFNHRLEGGGLRDCGLVQMRSEGRASWFSLAQPRLLKKVLKAADYLAAASGSHPSLREHLARDQRNENCSIPRP